MRILYISEYRLDGGGFSAITEGMALALHRQGVELKVLGISYDGREHELPISVIPLLDAGFLQVQANTIIDSWQPDAVVFAHDLSHHRNIMNAVRGSETAFRYIGIFPTEGAPLHQAWAQTINEMDGRLTLSQFGVETCRARGCDVRLLPVSYTPRILKANPDDRAQMRTHVGFDGKFVILKIADNHTRKNWAETLEYFALWHSPNDVLYAVTRPENAWGWDLQDLAQDFGAERIPDTSTFAWADGAQFRVLHNLTRHELAWVLNVSDCMLVDSGNEGLCMPILEAFAVDLPVVGMNHTAIGELLADGRGILFESGYPYRDPFGNVERYHIDQAAWRNALTRIKYLSYTERDAMTARARMWLRDRTWDNAANVLLSEIER